MTDINVSPSKYVDGGEKSLDQLYQRINSFAHDTNARMTRMESIVEKMVTMVDSIAQPIRLLNGTQQVQCLPQQTIPISNPFPNLRPCDPLSSVPGLGKTYSSRFCALGFKTIADLACVDDSPHEEARAKRISIISKVSKNRGALTEPVFTELLVKMKYVVRRHEQRAMASSSSVSSSSSTTSTTHPASSTNTSQHPLTPPTEGPFISSDASCTLVSRSPETMVQNPGEMTCGNTMFPLQIPRVPSQLKFSTEPHTQQVEPSLPSLLFDHSNLNVLTDLIDEEVTDDEEDMGGLPQYSNKRKFDGGMGEHRPSPGLRLWSCE